MNKRVDFYVRWILVITTVHILSTETSFSQSPPITSVGTASLTAGTYTVPITVAGLNNAGNISLSLNYNPQELIYNGVTLNSGLVPSKAVTTPVTDQSGTFRLSYVSGTPIILNAPATMLITLNFTARLGVQGVHSLLTWSTLQGANDITPPAPGSYVPEITVANMANYFVNGFIDILVPEKTLNLTLFLEGLYASGSIMNQAQGTDGNQFPGTIADVITVELHSSLSGQYATIVYSASSVNLSTTGQASVGIPSYLADSYYITIRHRNSITTVSASPVTFAGNTIAWNFSTSAAMAYGDRLKAINGVFVIYSGDVNQDGMIDTADFIPVDNDSFNYATGYHYTDVDGNGIVDTNDFIIIDNNNFNYIGAIHP